MADVSLKSESGFPFAIAEQSVKRESGFPFASDSDAAKALAAVGNPRTVDGLMDVLRGAVAQHVQSGFAIGCGLIALKGACEHGEYLDRVQDIGFSVRSARNYVAAAAYAIGTGRADVFAALPAKKLNALRKAIPDLRGAVVTELLDEDGCIAGLTPEEIGDMNAEQFAAEISDVYARLVDTTDHRDALKLENADLKARLDAEREKARHAGIQKLPGRLDLPAFAAEARQELAVGADQAGLALGHLRTIFQRQLEPRQQAMEDDELRAARNAAGLLYFNLNALRAELDALQQQVGAAFPDVLAGLLPQYTLSEEEAGMARAAGRELRARLEVREQNRAVERKHAAARREGRAGRPAQFKAER